MPVGVLFSKEGKRFRFGLRGNLEDDATDCKGINLAKE